MKKVLLTIVVLVLVSGSAFADHIWHYNTIFQNDGYMGSALALRNNQAWPTVVSVRGYDVIDSFTQTPVGWMQGPTDNINAAPYIRAASSDSGKAAFVTPFTAYTIGPNGWAGFDISNDGNVRDVAFNSNDQVAVLQAGAISTFNGLNWSESTWRGQQYQGMYDGVIAASITYDSYGQANVLGYHDGKFVYGMQGSLTNDDWVFEALPIGNYIGLGDLALTANDVPVFAYVDDYNGLSVCSYDIKTNSWLNNQIENDFGGQDKYSYVLDSDSKGGVGLAYVAGEYLKYQYFDGASWSSAEVLANAFNQWGTIGLDFDFEDNPVISYTGRNPDDESYGLIVAYDPIVTPEPVTLALLSLGGLLVSRRR